MLHITSNNIWIVINCLIKTSFIFLSVYLSRSLILLHFLSLIIFILYLFFYLSLTRHIFFCNCPFYKLLSLCCWGSLPEMCLYLSHSQNRRHNTHAILEPGNLARFLKQEHCLRILINLNCVTTNILIAAAYGSEI